MALSNEKFEEIKSKIQNFIDNEMVVHENDFNINHKFAEHLPFLEEKRNKVREMGLFAPQISKEHGGLGLSLHQLGQTSRPNKPLNFSHQHSCFGLCCKRITNF